MLPFLPRALFPVPRLAVDIRAAHFRPFTALILTMVLNPPRARCTTRSPSVNDENMTDPFAQHNSLPPSIEVKIGRKCPPPQETPLFPKLVAWSRPTPTNSIIWPRMTPNRPHHFNLRSTRFWNIHSEIRLGKNRGSRASCFPFSPRITSSDLSSHAWQVVLPRT